MEQFSEKKNRGRRLPLAARIGIFLGGVVVVLAAAYLACCAAVDQNTVLGRAAVNGVELDGMTYDEAVEAVTAAYEADYADAVLTVTLDGETYQVDLDGVLSLDAEAAVDQAFARGHGSFLTRGAALLASLVGQRSYEQLPAVADQNLLLEVIDLSGLLAVDTGTATTSEVQEDVVLLTKGVAGQVVDTPALVALILEAIARDDYDTVLDCPMTEGSLSDTDLQAIYDQIYVEPVDATLDPEQDYAIVDSVTGVSFDLEAAQVALDAAEEGETVEVPLIYTEPDITTELMEENLFRDRLGTYSTAVAGTNNRKTNVKLSAAACNGVILLPGETFSYNDTVGQRTEEAGYKTATAYSNGDSVQELGGGICQTSSTLYLAVMLANLEITERTNHTYAASYVPLGEDATVSWGGPDFKFTNNTAYPIKIVTSYSSGNTLTCTVYGTNLEGTTVEITNEVLSTTAYKVKKEDDDSMYEGETSVKVEGETGYTVQTYRNVYGADGSLISTTEEAYSVYKKRDEVLLVGTKEKKKSSDSSNKSGSSGSSNSGSSNSGSSDSADATGSSGSSGNSGSADSSGDSDSANTGSSDSSGDSGSASTGSSDSSGDSGSADSGSTDSSGDSGSADSGSSGDSGSADSSGDSGSADSSGDSGSSGSEEGQGE